MAINPPRRVEVRRMLGYYRCRTAIIPDINDYRVPPLPTHPGLPPPADDAIALAEYNQKKAQYDEDLIMTKYRDLLSCTY
jgi:hypothetical protein